MTDPRTLSIKNFTYSLPEKRIANYPLAERDASRLLVYKDGKISEDIYRHIADHLPADSLLVFNDTKVVEARLLFQKPTGGVIEIFCSEPGELYPDITTAMLQHEKVVWHCLIGGASKWKHGQVLEKRLTYGKNELTLKAKYIRKNDDNFTIGLSWNDPSLSFAEILHLFGAIPLPPYIKRQAEAGDAERYQTVYAHHEGSVAAPTAGLHFTEKVFERLKEKNIQNDFATLHVGAGTFMPVKSTTIGDHEMHAEYFSVSKAFIENIIRHADKNIIAVGTTSLRTMESLYWLGVKAATDNRQLIQGVGQWEVYDYTGRHISAVQALRSLVNWMEYRQMDRLTARTQIIITPGYRIKIANGLVTNFHQPQSTLLLLVAACIGSNWKKVYEYALENNFRFLSYGDGCLLWMPSLPGSGPEA
jgi:S-adenosylmethionine:tRNA ribosyltransferase-isomerase